jgi:hypothetical protein
MTKYQIEDGARHSLRVSGADAQQSNAVLYKFSGLHSAERQPGETRTQMLLISY